MRRYLLKGYDTDVEDMKPTAKPHNSLL